MSEELKKVRKGTKSCTECRRRKVRCTWSSDDAASAGARKLTSRDRISRLEKQVATLSKALRGAEAKSGEPDPSALATPEIGHDDEYGSDDSTSSSIVSDLLAQEHPTHLHSLFDNDLLSSDTKNENMRENHHMKAVGEISNATRTKLQEFIPSIEEVRVIAQQASRWLSLFHSLFPAPSVIKTGSDMIERYDAVNEPTADPAYLASYVISIAMTVHQVPKEKLAQLPKIRNAGHYSKAVSDAVESTLMRHDTLLGTVEGIDAAMLFLRLQLSRGNFRKTWIQLRHVIAIAELIGMHRVARRNKWPQQRPQEGHFWNTDHLSIQERKVQVWESLCSVDRISGMMFNLPPATRRYQFAQHSSIVVDGHVSLREYLCALSEIAMKVQDLDDLDVKEAIDTELYTSVLKIDGELRGLASVTPASWWQQTDHMSAQLLQFWHFYITVRAHLPFSLRHDTGEQFSFSRLACMKACQTLLARYITLRSQLPSGFFLCRLVDLQAFTATVVLIMACHAASPMELANLAAQGSGPGPGSPEILVRQILDFMKSISHQPVADFARRGVETISALADLLDSKNQSTPKELVLKVPLVGKIHVRRKQSPNSPSSKPSVNHLSTDPHATQNMPANQAVNGNDPNLQQLAMANGLQLNSGMAWDPLSWSIEDDQEAFFQDVLMAEDPSPFTSWWDQSSVNSNYDMSSGGTAYQNV